MGQTRNLERNFKYFELIENENTNYQNVSDAVKAVLKGKFVTLEKWTWKSLSRFQFFTTPWNIQCMEFSRPEYWSGKPFLSPGIFPTTQRSNPGLLHCGQILYQLSHKGSPRMLEWVAYPFSGGSSQPRNWTRVSCTAGRLFANWAMRKTHNTGCIY